MDANHSPRITYTGHSPVRITFADNASPQPNQPSAQIKGQAPNAVSQNTGPVTNQLPIYSYSSIFPQRRLTYINQNRDLQALHRLKRSGYLGFDMEWRPNFEKGQQPNPVAVIQLSGEDDVVVVQIIRGIGFIPPCLKEILESNDIAKIGVGIEGDSDKLLKDWGIGVCNLIDLSPMARALDPYWDEQDEIKAKEQETERLRKAQELAAAATAKGEPTPTTTEIASPGVEADEAGRRLRHKGNEQDQRPRRGRSLGLAALTERYLSMKLLKTSRIRTGNWEGRLMEDQLKYAANDAAVAYDIYCCLQQMETSVTHS
ncbi:hypothetical protein CPB86DRAFT_868886 [Serendipita vermifera]|nr:hypothetical protein CPB86DRAFT_868886 [Serendipita vermifera]